MPAIQFCRRTRTTLGRTWRSSIRPPGTTRRRERSCCSTGPRSRGRSINATSAWPRAGTATTSSGSRIEPVLSPSVEGFDGATIQDPRMVKMDGWYYVTYACRHYPFGQFWVPEVRKKYLTPAECPECFPRYLRINATLTGLLLTRDFKSVDSGRLADRPPAGRPRRGPVPGEGRRQVRHDAPAAGVGRAAVRRRAGQRLDLLRRRPDGLSPKASCCSRTSTPGRRPRWASTRRPSRPSTAG